MKVMMEKSGRKMRSVRKVFIFMVIILLGLFLKDSWAQPYIISITPANKTINIPINTNIRIQFSTTMDTTNYWFNLRDEYDNDIGGTSWWTTTTLTNDTLGFTPSNALRPATHYSFEGNGQSATGGGVNFNSKFITKFSTADVTPPTVQTVYPYDGMTGFSTGSSIHIKFSEAMNPGTINSSNITISGLSSSDYTVKYGFGDGWVEIKKSTSFAPFSPYTVTITTNVKDLRGNWLKEEYHWSFTTGAADTTAPTVTQTIPATDDTKVNTFPTIYAIFSEEMDESTLSTSTITLYDVTTSSGVPINIYWTDVDIVAFGPQSPPLANDHIYSVTIGTGVKDLAGNGLSTPYTWSFTVAGVGVNSDPVINSGTSSGDQRGLRYSDGSTKVSLEVDARDDYTSSLTVTATTPGHAPWVLSPTGGYGYSYDSTGDEGLSSGTHTLTFTIQDGATPPNQVTFERNIFIFDSSPILSSPGNGDSGVSTTPTFEWSYSGTLRPLYYQVAVFNGPNPDTARIVWQGYMVDKGSGTHSVSIPVDKQLAPNTTYYWGVMGANNEDNGETYSTLLWSFTTGGTPPPAPHFVWVTVRGEDYPPSYPNMWKRALGGRVLGPSPADIVELKVTGPGGFQYIFTEDNIVQSEQLGHFFWNFFPMTLPNGTYTFTVTDLMGRTATVSKSFASASVPRVATMSPGNNSYLGITTPTLIWGSVGSGYYYRVDIIDWNNNQAAVYISPYTQDTHITVPSGYLMPNTPYKWYVEVYDAPLMNRSVSDMFAFSTGSFPYTLDLNFGILLADNNYYNGQGKLLVANVLGPLPNHVSKLEVTGPEGFTTYDFQESNITYNLGLTGSLYTVFQPGFPPNGTYNFDLEDIYGATDSSTKDETSAVIPIADQATFSPANNAYLSTLTPTLTWAAVGGSNRYYRVQVRNWRTSYIIYASAPSTDPFVTIPSGILRSNQSYKWCVEVYDDPNGVVADNRSMSMWSSFNTVCTAPPVIDSIAFKGCISELCTSPIQVGASDPCGGSLTYNYQALDGGSIIGSGPSVAFAPPTISPGYPCPHRVRVTVISSNSGLATSETIGISVKIAGDINGDGKVNATDKLLWRKQLGWQGTPGAIPEDINCDGKVDATDQSILSTKLGFGWGCVCK